MKNSLLNKKICILFFLIIPMIFCAGCETLYKGEGYVVHNDQEAINFAWVWFNQEKYDESKKMANVALEINPHNADGYNILGLVELRANALEKSIEYLEKANDIDNGKDTPILHNLGFAYFKNKEYKKSLQIFNNSIKEKDTCFAQLGRAISLYKLGDINKNDLKEYVGCRDRADFVKDTKNLFNYFAIEDKDLEGFVNFGKAKK